MHDADQLFTNGRFELPPSARRIVVVPIERRGKAQQVPIATHSNGLFGRVFRSSFVRAQKRA